ncbi:hypothetical protein DPMN_152892 [Dreissena polymorpha]|uniref:Uncharacterized protein n=1 Tax=Dreissena polymorpha TaxID=45954 RepID=A0A9D4FM46_DREPO|nr:hypothetical protein DPMN_152892 [Dreissena polymorpha]
MKLGQKICPNDILEEFENGSGCVKNMASKGRGIFPNSKTAITQGSTGLISMLE